MKSSNVGKTILRRLIIIAAAAPPSWVREGSGQGSLNYTITPCVMSGRGRSSLASYLVTGMPARPSAVHASESESDNVGSGFWAQRCAHSGSLSGASRKA